MGGDKKPSAEFFQSGHGKTVLAEAFLSDEQIRRVLRTTAADLEALSWAGTHGVGRERHAVGRVHARVGDRRDLRRDRPGSRHGRHELDGARHRRGASRAGCRRRSASAASRSARSAAARRCRRRATGSRRSAARAPARSTASRRSSRPPRSASRSAPRRRWPPPAARTSSRRTTNGAGFGDRARLPLRRARPGGVRGGLRPEGEWAQFFRQGAGYIGTELLRDVEEPDRYLVIDRWESIDAYNRFSREHQAEYLRRSRRVPLPLPPGAAVRDVRERLGRRRVSAP